MKFDGERKYRFSIFDLNIRRRPALLSGPLKP
jgi:hypothetical protein